jgi:hypothetical protein
MRRLGYILPGLALLLPLWVPPQRAGADEETEMPLGEVPAAVLAAVRNARPDIKIHSAERLTDESVVLYEIEGDVGDDELEFTVRPDGTIVETDRE